MTPTTPTASFNDTEPSVDRTHRQLRCRREGKDGKPSGESEELCSLPDKPHSFQKHQQKDVTERQSVSLQITA
ncbi:hypothetical protein GCM10011502_04140 [Oceanisphaera marina]|uniref:Uncharacterized protein n=1 Tax=Oceanisphaera marina TaxID=2017550 RepID=A0ABQ1IC95_9GAMM|nr:hypothetical protein GCM10011502_04140 [Oceanisphaera marina]